MSRGGRSKRVALLDNLSLPEILGQNQYQRSAGKDAIYDARGKHEYHQGHRDDTVDDRKNKAGTAERQVDAPYKDSADHKHYNQHQSKRLGAVRCRRQPLGYYQGYGEIIGGVRMRVTQPRNTLKLTSANAASISEQAYPSDFS